MQSWYTFYTVLCTKKVKENSIMYSELCTFYYVLYVVLSLVKCTYILSLFFLYFGLLIVIFTVYFLLYENEKLKRIAHFGLFVIQMFVSLYI